GASTQVGTSEPGASGSSLEKPRQPRPGSGTIGRILIVWRMKQSRTAAVDSDSDCGLLTELAKDAWKSHGNTTSRGDGPRRTRRDGHGAPARWGCYGP